MENLLKMLLKNKELPARALPLVESLAESGDKALFAIVGDMGLDGKYGETTLLFTAKKAVLCDASLEGVREYLYEDMEDVRAKRMYGNATLSAKMKSGKREIFFRYTYGVAALCDAAALFISHLNEGKSFNEEYAIISVAYEKALSVCPKCGRPLLHPGAECIMCRSKKKIVKQLSKYILPHTKTLVFCIFLSLFTTFMALVPPAITGFIVDAVFPGGSGTSTIPILGAIKNAFQGEPKKVLTAMIILLLSTYILQYGIGIRCT